MSLPRIGTWPAKTLGASFGLDSKGNATARVHFELLKGPDEGASITYNGLISTKSAPYVRKDLSAVGWKGKSVKDLELDVSEWIRASGGETIIEIEHKTAARENAKPFAVVRSIGRGTMPLQEPAARDISDADNCFRSAFGTDSDGNEGLPF